MELKFEIISRASMDANFYGKVITDSSDLCMVCMTDETEDGKQWDRYKLKCGHIAHTRCFRNWCGKKNKVNCPLCGDIEQIKQNRYCTYCKKYGHTDIIDGCELFNKDYRRELRKDEAAFRKTKVVTLPRSVRCR